MLRRILQMLTGAAQYRNKWERMTGKSCQPPVRQDRGRPWPTSPPPPKKREGVSNG